MLEFFKQSKPYQLIIWGLMLFTTLIATYTPDVWLFKVGASFAVQIMFGFLILGLLFLFISDSKSMFVSFICCGILCLFLRNREPFYPEPSGNLIKIAHIDLEDCREAGINKTIQTILKTDADVVTFQHIDPKWDQILKNQLKDRYKHEATYMGLTLFDAAVYSKFPFMKVDTFHYMDAPNIYGTVPFEGKTVNFLLSNTTPPVNVEAYQSIREQLIEVGDFIAKSNAPYIALGDYNVTSHSAEMLELKNRSNLKDSRIIRSPMVQSPNDHILFSEHLQCVDFTSILATESTTKIGISGLYQYNPEHYAQ